MVPTNQPLPVQQRLWNQPTTQHHGLPGGVPRDPPYTMAFQKDNWTYFGTTGFPASATTQNGSMAPWRPLTYINSIGGNNAGTANSR